MSGSPLEQFRVHEWFGLGQVFGQTLAFTNSSFFMCLAVSLCALFLHLGTKNLEVKPTSRLQVAFESVHGFLSDLLKRSVTHPEVNKFFPLVFTIFLFVIACNLLGMLPYGFTSTSQIIVTFAMGVGILIFVTICGILRNGLGFFRIFLPSGVPMWLSPAVILIEAFAFLARSLTLSLRLTANMIAGHTMLKVIAGLALGAGTFAFLPFTFIVVITAFELFVASLQAYIFATLVCVYLNDIFSAH